MQFKIEHAGWLFELKSAWNWQMTRGSRRGNHPRLQSGAPVASCQEQRDMSGREYQVGMYRAIQVENRAPPQVSWGRIGLSDK